MAKIPYPPFFDTKRAKYIKIASYVLVLVAFGLSWIPSIERTVWIVTFSFVILMSLFYMYLGIRAKCGVYTILMALVALFSAGCLAQFLFVWR